MKRKIWGNIGLGVLFWGSMLLGCQGDAPTVALSQTEMEEILGQMHIADAWVDEQGGPLYLRNRSRDDLYDEILDQWSTDRATFYQSYQYYLAHPTELDSIYARMIRGLETELDTLRARKPRYDRLQQAAEAWQDSVAQANPDTLSSDDSSQVRPKGVPQLIRQTKPSSQPQSDAEGQR